MNNPLQKYMRSPKIYAKLPSRGKYYTEEVIELSSATDEVGILPMTANDELTLTTPDALLNGEGIKEVVQSCCPSVKNAGLLTSGDIDVILLGIRYSSYGDKLPFVSKCPKCGYENKFSASIRAMLESIEFLDPPYVVELNKNLKVFVKPHTYNVNTKISLQAFETSKLLKAIQTKELEDLEEIAKYNSSFRKIAEISVEIILDAIDKVVISENGNKVEVKDAQQIFEWLKNISKKEVDAIREKIKEINTIGPKRNIEVQCENRINENELCNHVWETVVEFNPSDFFD